DQCPSDGALGSHTRAPSPGWRGRKHCGVLGWWEHCDGRRLGMWTAACFVERRRPLGAEPLLSEAFHHELQAALRRVIEVAMPHEDVDERFSRRQPVTAGNEL